MAVRRLRWFRGNKKYAWAVGVDLLVGLMGCPQTLRRDEHLWRKSLIDLPVGFKRGLFDFGGMTVFTLSYFGQIVRRR